MRSGRRTCVALLLLIPAIPAQEGLDRQDLTARSDAELLSALAKDEDGTATMVELRRRGAACAAALAESLRVPHLGDHELVRARERALRVLHDLREAGAPAVPALVACLRDTELSDWIVTGAAAALVRIAPFAGEQRRPLLDALPRGMERRRDWRREWYASWEGLVSSLAFDALGQGRPELLAALEGEDPHARNAACAALVARQAEFAEHADAIATALRAELDRAMSLENVWHWRADGIELSCTTSLAGWRAMQTEVARALHAYAPEDPKACLAVCQELWDLDPQRRIAAAGWLGDQRLVDAGHWLCLIAEDLGAPTTAFAAIDALRRIGPELGHLAPRLHVVAARARGSEAVSRAAPRLATLARATARALDPGLETREPVRGRVQILGSGVDHVAAIDLDAERARLVAWLDRDGGAERHRLRHDERVIADYHALASDRGGRISARIRWLPLRVLPDELRLGFWMKQDALLRSDCVIAAPADHVGPGFERHRDVPWVVVLVPCDAERGAFSAGELHGVREGVDRFGRAVMQCSIHREATAAFAALTRELLANDDSLLLLVDGLVIGSAVFNGVGGSQAAFVLRPGCEERLLAVRTKLE